MERFYFEKPSLERKDEIKEYLDEFIEYGSEINGVGGLDKIYDGMTIEEAIENCVKKEDKEYAESVGRVATSTYLMIRESDDRIVGICSFRHYLNDYLRKVGGHIGYGVRPTERRKGYNKIQLYHALLEAQKLGIDSVMLDCVDTNPGSEKTIQALGGVFDGEYYDEGHNANLHNYWINVDESIEKYKDIYGQYIIKEKTK